MAPFIASVARDEPNNDIRVNGAHTPARAGEALPSAPQSCADSSGIAEDGLVDILRRELPRSPDDDRVALLVPLEDRSRPDAELQPYLQRHRDLTVTFDRASAILPLLPG